MDLNRVALLCPGVGRVDRGYEVFAEGLYDALCDDLDMVFLTGDGDGGERRFPVGGLSRNRWAARLLGKVWNDRFVWEQLSFAFAVWPRIARGSFDLVHYSEPALNNVFMRLERFSKHSPPRLFTHGLRMSPEHCVRCHHLHQVSRVAYDDALRFGVPADRMSLLELGVNDARFFPHDLTLREQLREQLGVPKVGRVILCVAALDRASKRVDRLVQAIGLLGDRYHLVLCGPVDDASVLAEARRSLPGRFTHLTVPHRQMNDVYALADLLVVPSLLEGFGLAVIEALFAGVPVLLHDCAHFRWLVGPSWDLFTDVGGTTTLAASIQDVGEKLAILRQKTLELRPEIVRRFAWRNLRDSYTGMYAKAVASPRVTIEQSLH